MHETVRIKVSTPLNTNPVSPMKASIRATHFPQEEFANEIITIDRNDFIHKYEIMQVSYEICISYERYI